MSRSWGLKDGESGSGAACAKPQTAEGGIAGAEREVGEEEAGGGQAGRVEGMPAALGLGPDSESRRTPRALETRMPCGPRCPSGEVLGGGCGGHRPGLCSHLREGPASVPDAVSRGPVTLASGLCLPLDPAWPVHRQLQR